MVGQFLSVSEFFSTPLVRNQPTNMTSSKDDIDYIIGLMSKISSVIDPGDESFDMNLYIILKIDGPGINFYKYKTSRKSHVEKTIELMDRLNRCLKIDQTLCASQCATVSKCIDSVVSLGLIPFFIPSLWKSFDYKQKPFFEFQDDIPLDEKNYELKLNLFTLFELVKYPLFKRLIFAEHPEVLLAGLCQLCLLPIAKPCTNIVNDIAINERYYKDLKKEQKLFKKILKEYIVKHKDFFLIREVIFAIGHGNVQDHIKHNLEDLLCDSLTADGGIQTFMKVACDHVAETSENIDGMGLQECSNVIHSIYKRSNTKYEELIVPQVWNLLRSSAKVYQHKFRSIGCFCVHLMLSENYNGFLEYYLRPIGRSMNIMRNKTAELSAVIPTCIDDLYTLFYLYKDATWSLNPRLLMDVAATIYQLYTATASGSYHLKSKLEDLVTLILTNFSDSKDHLRLIIFSEYQIDVTFDDNGNIIVKIDPDEQQFNIRRQLDAFLDLIDKRFDLKTIKIIFGTLLDIYTENKFETNHRILEKSFIYKSVGYLVEKVDLMNSIREDPGDFLFMTKLLLESSVREKYVDFNQISILIKVLGCFLENIDQTYIGQLKFFLKYSSSHSLEREKLLKDILLDICQKFKNVKKSFSKEVIINKNTNYDVLKDTTDYYWAHELMEFKKMIDAGDKTVLALKSDILYVIQEYLKNADSYIYLSAIFTLSSLCTYYPEDILSILCAEFIKPEMCYHSSEIRLKIGKVLKKTMNSLDEDAIPWLSNRLCYTFMDFVLDEDQLMRVSGLNNLYSFCRLVDYDLGSSVAIIVECVDFILEYDQSVLPRNGAVSLFELIIDGCSLELLKDYEGSLKKMYQTLEIQYQYENNKTTKSYIQKTIKKLNKVMKKLLL